MEKQIRTGRAVLLPGPLSFTGYFNPIKNPSNQKKRFVKNPLFPSAFGQNKTLKLRQNKVVINIYSPTGKWECGQRLDNKSRMTGDCHVRFPVDVGVRFPRVTRLVDLQGYPSLQTCRCNR